MIQLFYILLVAQGEKVSWVAEGVATGKNWKEERVLAVSTLC